MLVVVPVPPVIVPVGAITNGVGVVATIVGTVLVGVGAGLQNNPKKLHCFAGVGVGTAGVGVGTAGVGVTATATVLFLLPNGHVKRPKIKATIIMNPTRIPKNNKTLLSSDISYSITYQEKIASQDTCYTYSSWRHLKFVSLAIRSCSLPGALQPPLLVSLLHY